MNKDIFSIMKRTANKFLVYHPPQLPTRFVLSETQEKNEQGSSNETLLSDAITQYKTLFRFAQRLSACMEKLHKELLNGKFLLHLDEFKQNYESLTKQHSELTPVLLGYNSNDELIGKRTVNASLDENRRLIEELYELPTSQGINIRTFTIAVKPETKAMLVFLDGLSDKKMVNQMVLKPLMSLADKKQPEHPLASRIITKYLPMGTANIVSTFTEIQDGINCGDTALFIEGSTEAILVDTKGIEHRSIERPQMEQTVRGSQQGFTELLDINVALIRNSLKVSDLVSEEILVGTRSRNTCAVLYIKSLANPSLVAEVKRRILNINTDYISDSSTLNFYMEDSPTNPFPQSLNTERPDRVSAHLAEGRVAVVVGGSPTVLVMPVTLFTLLHSPDDYSMQYLYSSLIRTVRVIGMALSMLLPALYLSISIYHPEAMPTDLLLSIMAAREEVPFPSIVEILIMELAFELIREGGIRVPGVLGPTIGIVGAIIIGQAAVVAKIVSPIMILIVAVTGLASYVIPDYRLANAVRLSRFFFLLLAATFGLVGIAAGILSLGAILSTLKSFGAPYLAPLTPRTFYGRDIILRGPVYDQELRPDFLQPLDKRRQPHISRSWINKPPEGSSD